MWTIFPDGWYSEGWSALKAAQVSPEPALLCQMSGLYDGFWGHQGPRFLKMFLSVPWDPPKGTLWSWNLLRSLSTRGSAARSAPSQADSVSRGRFSRGQQFKACSWSSVPDIRTLPQLCLQPAECQLGSLTVLQQLSSQLGSFIWHK